MSRVETESFFHEATGTVTHIVWDSLAGDAAVIDPVLDYAVAGADATTGSADELLRFVGEAGLRLCWILETHAHADHLSASEYLKVATGALTGIGAGICKVQETFRDVFNLGPDFPCDGSQFDHLFRDGERFMLGEISVTVLATPGHTEDSISYLVGDAALFVGDTLFRPDYGSARCDFPGGDAGALYDSVRRLFELPDELLVYLCHDYPERDQEVTTVTTIGEQRAGNVHLRDGIKREEFAAMRRARDAGLGLPAQIIPAVQVNIRAGRLPPAEDNGISYLKYPVSHFLSAVRPGSET